MEIDGLGEWFDSYEVGQMQWDLEERIMMFLFNQETSDFERMVAQLAWIGTRPETKAFLHRDIIQLHEDSIEQVGFWKSIWKGTKKTCQFIEDHAVDIAIGVGVVAAAGVIIATGGSASVVVGGVVVAGAGSLFASNETSNPHIPQSTPSLSKSQQEALQQATTFALPKLDLPASVDEIHVTANGIWAGGQYFPNSTFSKNSHFAAEFAKLPSPAELTPQNVNENLVPLPIPQSNDTPQLLPEDLASRTQTNDMSRFISGKFVVEGKKPSAAIHIGWINGIANSCEESEESAAYIQKLAGGHQVSGVYNRTHTPVVDIAESTALNHFLHYSPITSDLLRSEWEAFHEANKDNPHAKCLQICHSQGAIHVRNTLEKVPEEIRNRIIVVAIAPAAIVPKELCFDSFNYASTSDVVHLLEPDYLRSFPLIYDGDLWDSSLDHLSGNRDQLILLQPHENATGIDHSFQSPTFKNELQEIIEDYHDRMGIYHPGETGQ